MRKGSWKAAPLLMGLIPMAGCFGAEPATESGSAPLQPDAGTDASTTDASTTDGGSSDAGSDQGSEDQCHWNLEDSFADERPSNALLAYCVSSWVVDMDFTSDPCGCAWWFHADVVSPSRVRGESTQACLRMRDDAGAMVDLGCGAAGDAFEGIPWDVESTGSVAECPGTLELELTASCFGGLVTGTLWSGEFYCDPSCSEVDEEEHWGEYLELPRR
jgi:hypothetical protein